MRVDPYPILFLDVETSGLSPKRHEILEVGAIRFDGPGCETSLSARVRPEHIETASARALEVCGYSPAKWAEAVPLSVALRALRRLIKGHDPYDDGAEDSCDTIGGHNVSFDLRFLRAADPRWVDPATVDTMAIAKRLKAEGELEGASLDDLCRHLRIPRPRPHRALDDARAAALAWFKLEGPKVSRVTGWKAPEEEPFDWDDLLEEGNDA